MKQALLIFIFALGLLSPLSYVNAGAILSSHKFAWSNNVGYINFGNVTVNDNALSGYAWSAYSGWIKFGPTQGGVLNDGAGNLSGFAWGEQLGWIDFNNVNIEASGKFSGTATGTLVGTITFDCQYCDVQADWRRTAASVYPSVDAAIRGNALGGQSIVLAPEVVAPVQGPAIPAVAIPANIQPAAQAENLPDSTSRSPMAAVEEPTAEEPFAYSASIPAAEEKNIFDISIEPAQKTNRPSIAFFALLSTVAAAIGIIGQAASALVRRRLFN